MEKEFLRLIPKRFLCPYCGEWHDWDKLHELGYYDSDQWKARFECSNKPNGYNKGDYRIYFYDDYLYYQTEKICRMACQDMSGRIPISSIIENPDKPIVTFDVEFTTANHVGSDYCSDCRSRYYCNCYKLGDKDDNCHMTITFGFEFEQSEYEQLSKTFKSARKEQQIKEDTTMANNNIFNLNMEFGPNKDENITSTLMGVAVKNDNSWRIYDKKKKEITDIGDIKLGNLPIFILPTTKLNEGDLIKNDGEYYFVMKSAKGNHQFLYAKTGELKTVVPTKNVLGFSCYSKVIAFSDSFNMSDDELDVEKMAIMSAMCGQSGDDNGQMNQLLPLMLFKDKLGGDDDMMKMIFMTSMMSVPAESGEQNTDMNQLLPLMLFKDKLGDDDDMMKMMFMTSMMSGGNMTGNNNPLMSYLILDKFMEKKKDEENPDQ